MMMIATIPVGADLKDKSTNHGDSDFLAMKWRRRHIENYFLDISAIARAAETSEEDIRNFFRDRHALAIPDSITSTDIAAALKDAHGKEIFISGENSLKHNFSITRDEVLEHMNKDEICDDIKYFCQCLINLSQS
ncbi:hypothetical protein VEE68_01820 [Escherichia coli]|nr:hypothetical protein VEE68_01820 [Escherichia coli]